MPRPLLKGGEGKLLPDLSLDEAKASGFDMIVMSGGRNGTPPLQKAPHVARLLRSFCSKASGTSPPSVQPRRCWLLMV